MERKLKYKQVKKKSDFLTKRSVDVSPIKGFSTLRQKDLFFSFVTYYGLKENERLIIQRIRVVQIEDSN